MKKQYWAVNHKSHFEILLEEPDKEWERRDGPFDTLLEAKKCARRWIAFDRQSLQIELQEINHWGKDAVL